MKRALVALATIGVALVALAGPAAADPAKPGDFTSRVTSVQPAVTGVAVQVAGGDGFLDVEVDRGHTAIVYGYEQSGTPTEYLQFLDDGTVQRNRNSPATYINDSRYGTIQAPENLPSEPSWETVATDGEYAWHDHRIHWMSPDAPPGHARGDVIYDDWQVPMQVDGTDVVVHGQLVWEKGTPSILWFGLVVVVAAGLSVLAGLKKLGVVAAGLLAGGLAAVVVSAVEYVSIPPNAGRSIVSIIIPALGVVTAAVTLVKREAALGAVTGLASAALLIGWAVLRLGVLTKPVLPTDLPFVVDRLGTILALGTALAGAVVIVMSGQLRLPELSDDEDDDG